MIEDGGRGAFLAAQSVSRETLERLDRFIAALDAGRRRANLIGPREWPQIWTRHIADSYALIDPIPDQARIVDLGSGAGFPGLVVAAAKPAATVTLIESTGKKCAFLRSAIESMGVPAAVHQGRVEEAPLFPADIVTARAFAPLPQLISYARPWLQSGAEGLFLKGERWKEELTAARQTWILSSEAIPNRSGGSGVILRIREVRPRHD